MMRVLAMAAARTATQQSDASKGGLIATLAAATGSAGGRFEARGDGSSRGSRPRAVLKRRLYPLVREGGQCLCR